MIITLKIDVDENKENIMETVEAIENAFRSAQEGVSGIRKRNNGYIENTQGKTIGRWEIKWPWTTN